MSDPELLWAYTYVQALVHGSDPDWYAEYMENPDFKAFQAKVKEVAPIPKHRRET